MQRRDRQGFDEREEQRIPRDIDGWPVGRGIEHTDLALSTEIEATAYQKGIIDQVKPIMEDRDFRGFLMAQLQSAGLAREVVNNPELLLSQSISDLTLVFNSLKNQTFSNDPSDIEAYIRFFKKEKKKDGNVTIDNFYDYMVVGSIKEKLALAKHIFKFVEEKGLRDKLEAIILEYQERLGVQEDSPKRLYREVDSKHGRREVLIDVSVLMEKLNFREVGKQDFLNLIQRILEERKDKLSRGKSVYIHIDGSSVGMAFKENDGSDGYLFVRYNAEEQPNLRPAVPLTEIDALFDDEMINFILDGLDAEEVDPWRVL